MTSEAGSMVGSGLLTLWCKTSRCDQSLRDSSSSSLCLQMRADVTIILDQALFPLLEMVRDEGSGERTEALFLMSTLVERHPASAVRLTYTSKYFENIAELFV